MYMAAIDKGQMVIAACFLDHAQSEIEQILKEGSPVILDTDKDRLEVMGEQMGLTVIDVIEDGT